MCSYDPYHVSGHVVCTDISTNGTQRLWHTMPAPLEMYPEPYWGAPMARPVDPSEFCNGSCRTQNVRLFEKSSSLLHKKGMIDSPNCFPKLVKKEKSLTPGEIMALPEEERREYVWKERNLICGRNVGSPTSFSFETYYVKKCKYLKSKCELTREESLTIRDSESNVSDDWADDYEESEDESLEIFSDFFREEEKMHREIKVEETHERLKLIEIEEEEVFSNLSKEEDGSSRELFEREMDEFRKISEKEDLSKILEEDASVLEEKEVIVYELQVVKNREVSGFLECVEDIGEKDINTYIVMDKDKICRYITIPSSFAESRELFKCSDENGDIRTFSIIPRNETAISIFRVMNEFEKNKLKRDVERENVLTHVKLSRPWKKLGGFEEEMKKKKNLVETFVDIFYPHSSLKSETNEMIQARERWVKPQAH